MSSTFRDVAARTGRRSLHAARMRDALEELVGAGRSFTELTVDDIIGAADVSRSSFYKAFESKGDLLCELLGDIIAAVEQSATAWFSLDASSSCADLRSALDAIVGAYAPHAVVIAAGYEVAHFDPDVATVMDDLFRRGVRGLSAYIAAGQAGGWIDPTLPPVSTATWLTAMTERGFQSLPGDVDRALVGLADLIWHALYVFR